MRIHYRQFVVSLALLLSSPLALPAQKSEPPTFETYPADVYAGKPAPLKVNSHPLARTYRTSIREQLRDEGINFAGHYTLAVMGCGTGCSITAIVDARNGRAYFPQVFNGWTSVTGDYIFAEGEDIRTFRTNSTLIKIIGRPRLGPTERWGPSGVYYYEWKDNQLRQLSYVSTSSHPHADPRPSP